MRVNGPSPTAASVTTKGPASPAGTSMVRGPAGAAVVSEPNTWLTSMPGGTKPASRTRSGIVTSGSTGPDVETSSVLRFTAKLSLRTGRPGASVAFWPGSRCTAGPVGPVTSRPPARVLLGADQPVVRGRAVRVGLEGQRGAAAEPARHPRPHRAHRDEQADPRGFATVHLRLPHRDLRGRLHCDRTPVEEGDESPAV